VVGLVDGVAQRAADGSKHGSVICIHHPRQAAQPDLELFLMPTLLADTNLFLWVDLENPTPEETGVSWRIFSTSPLSIEDCVTVSQAPKVEEYLPKKTIALRPTYFIVIHAVDYSRKDGAFATSELDFFLGKNFLVTYHMVPLKSVHFTEERCLKSAGSLARAPDRLAHNLLDGIVDNYTRRWTSCRWRLLNWKSGR